MQEKDDMLQTNCGATIWGLALLALAGIIRHWGTDRHCLVLVSTFVLIVQLVAENH